MFPDLCCLLENACWFYLFCFAKKNCLLPFSSSNSRINKRGMIQSCSRQSLEKSCPHRMLFRWNAQPSICLLGSIAPTGKNDKVKRSTVRATLKTCHPAHNQGPPTSDIVFVWVGAPSSQTNCRISGKHGEHCATKPRPLPATLLYGCSNVMWVRSQNCGWCF